VEARAYPRLAMLGAAPETRGAIAAVVEAYRAHGLFERWPIEYLATHGEGGLTRDARLALDTARRFTLLIARHRRLAVHLHLGLRRPLWRQAPFMAAALAARCPLLLQLHGGGFERAREDSLLRPFLERAACVMVSCEAMRSWVRNVARNAHAVCLPYPVSPAPLAALDAPRQNLVLYLGRLRPAKGIFDLLEAVAGLRRAVPDVRLVCTGDGDRVSVARYAARLGIADAVKFTGWVGPSGKRALLESAAVYAAPSYDEGLPISLLEAMAAGVPVLASAVGGIPEAVVDGVSGFLFAPGDKATLERLLRTLLLERELAARVGAAARESARLRFAPERAVPRLEELYASIGLAARDAPRGPVLGMRKAA
jgi:glycosyltransferase involved in cell wall biosynthesis